LVQWGCYSQVVGVRVCLGNTLPVDNLLIDRHVCWIDRCGTVDDPLPAEVHGSAFGIVQLVVLVFAEHLVERVDG
jgi:hypothetical protein